MFGWEILCSQFVMISAIILVGICLVMLRCHGCNQFLSTGAYCEKCMVDNTCRNCHRLSSFDQVFEVEYHRVQVSSCDLSNGVIRNNRRKKYATLKIGKNETAVCLCAQCRSYLQCAKPDNGKTEYTWPVVVWKMLEQGDLIDDAWPLIPQEWREWWIHSVVRCHKDVTMAMLSNSISCFNDATLDCMKDTIALEENIWKGLMDREESLVIPWVKCPAGCSEFKHKANELPFDLVFQEILRRPLKNLLEPAQARATGFTRIFRSDYLVPERIANNPRWLCRPTISKMGSGAPVVLCCRHHSVKSRHQMVHPPRNPTGNLSSGFSGTLSPVVPIPRTIQKARISSHSASFHMAHMEGSFCGLDTMYLKADSMIQSVNSTLGWQQDALTFSGRSDVRAYTSKRYRDGGVGSIGKALEIQADKYPYLPEMKQFFLHGASYVGLNKAVQMQQHINDSPPEIGWKIDGRGRRVPVQFKGHYPRMLVYAHPAISSAGCRPPQPPPYKSISKMDNRAAWLLSSMMLLVPEIWHAISSLPGKEQHSWEGNLLTFLTVKCLDHIKPFGTTSSPFPRGISAKKLLEDHFEDSDPRSNGSRTFRMDHLRGYIQNSSIRAPTMLLAAESFPLLRDIPEETKAIVITRDYSLDDLDTSWTVSDTVKMGGRTWKLCYISRTTVKDRGPPNSWDGVILCRHSDKDFSQWWRVERHGSFPVGASIADVSEGLPSWDTAVYVDCDTYITPGMRDSMLTSCGGQHKTYCLEHNYPLISTCQTDTVACSCNATGIEGFGEPMSIPTASCQAKPVFRCAVTGCSSGICRKHQASVVSWSGKYFVGKRCGYSDIRDQIDDVFDLDNEDGFARDLDFLEGGTQVNDSMGDGNDDYANDNHDERFEAYFRLQDAELESDDFFVTENRTGTADSDMVNADVQYDGAMETQPRDDLLTTDPGTLPIYTHVDQGSNYASSTVSNHVLLNNFGHMLIRRNKRLDGTSNQRHFLQRLVSRVPGDTLPLVYPEGMLFADMFNCDTLGGDIIGALPSPFLNSDSTLNGLGFASLQDHFRCRLSNPALFSASDPKYHLFAFDCLSNLSLRGCDSRVILRRGFAENQGDGGVRFKNSAEESLFDTEHVDSSAVVCKLAAAVNERNPTYFYTHTCSMRTHFGMKLIWDWLTSEDVVDSYCSGGETETEREGLRTNIVEGNGVLLLRAWMEMMHIWINYITRSPEQPIGEVDQFLFRMELQDAKANLPHLHALLWTLDDLGTEEGMKKVLDRIRGFILDIIRPDEREKFKTMGVFEDDPAVERFLNMVQTFLTHKHTRRCIIVEKDVENGGEPKEVLRCKANNNWKDNPSPSEHSFVEIPVKHSQDAIDVMLSLDLGSLDKQGRFIASEKCLQAVKHYPPAHGNEGIVSPVFAGLLPINPNMGNAQFASGYTLSRYLAKYIVSVDVYNTITIAPPKPKEDPNTFNVVGEELPNQKITGNQIRQEKRAASQKPNTKMPAVRHGRAFNVVEFYMLLYGYSPVMTNIAFVNISTKPYDERSGRDRLKPSVAIQGQTTLQHVALSPLNCLPSHMTRIRLGLPSWRQFFDTQVQMAYDDLQSPVSTSSVTSFGVRPPELMFAARHQDYRRWFVEARVTGTIEKQLDWCSRRISSNHTMSSWVDGFMSEMKVRAAAIPAVIACLERRQCAWFDGYDAMLSLFRELEQALEGASRRTIGPTTLLDQNARRHNMLLRKFVTELDKPRLPVVWFHLVRPTFNTKFLIHLLLSLGFVKDEYDLFGCPDLRHCFVKAGLLDEDNPERSALELMKIYVIEQLAGIPKATLTFDRYLVAAQHTIAGLFVHNRLFSDTLPLALYCRVVENTDDEVKEFQNTRKTALVNNLIAKLTDCGFPDLPASQECIEATFFTIVPWDMLSIPRGAEQPEDSYVEQMSTLKLGKHLIDEYKSGPAHYTKGLCHVGAGGVGKTTVMFLELLYSLCLGLMAGITAINSERAQELAGLHIHDLFAMQGREILSPGQMAERACSALYRNPKKLEYLKRLDVLAFDEAGAIPCEMLSAICITLRYVRDNNLPFGGLLIICTMDYLQLEPVSGRHPLMSAAFTACFYFRELVHSVRAAADANWRRIQAITRMDQDTLSLEATRSEFVSLFTATCSFVDSLDDPKIPRSILYSFGKKAPIRTQESRVINKVTQSSIVYRTSIAVDEEKNTDGNFRKASSETSKVLDKTVKEPRTLVLFVGGRYQITFNKGALFSSSQLAILFDLPTEEDVQAKRAIKMIVAPAGSRYIPDETVTREALLEMGWSQKSVGCPTSWNVSNTPGSTRSKRHQYGLRHHVGSTIHGVQGQTLAGLLTRVDRGDRMHPYSLWLSSQVVVLLSRTRLGKQTYFWVPNGVEPKDVAETLYDLLCRTSPFRTYLGHLLRQLCADGPAQDYTIDNATNILRPKDFVMPTHELGYVYLIVSTKQLGCIYIGSAKSLTKRWRKHNAGYAAEQTRTVHLRPWALLAFITGFTGDEKIYTDVENQWIARKQDLVRDPSILASVEAIHNIGKDVVHNYNTDHQDQQLRFVSCGTMERIRAAQTVT